MSDRATGAIGTGDGLPIAGDVMEAAALGADHGEVLRPFDPGDEIMADTDALSKYIDGFNAGMRRACSNVVGLIEEVRVFRVLKGEKVNAAATNGATGATGPDVEKEIAEARRFGSSNSYMENFKRQRAGLPELSDKELIQRAARISDYLAAKRADDHTKWLGV